LHLGSAGSSSEVGVLTVSHLSNTLRFSCMAGLGGWMGVQVNGWSLAGKRDDVVSFTLNADEQSPSASATFARE
jgi:hypothetical protein